MIIRNKYLNITNQDVEKQNDLSILYKWLLDVEENITAMEITINRAKTKAHREQIFADTNWFNRLTTANRLQKLLKNQIVSKIKFLEQLQELNTYVLDIVKSFYSKEDWSKIVEQAGIKKQETINLFNKSANEL